MKINMKDAVEGKRIILPLKDGQYPYLVMYKQKLLVPTARIMEVTEMATPSVLIQQPYS